MLASILIRPEGAEGAGAEGEDKELFMSHMQSLRDVALHGTSRSQRRTCPILMRTWMFRTEMPFTQAQLGRNHGATSLVQLRTWLVSKCSANHHESA